MSIASYFDLRPTESDRARTRTRSTEQPVPVIPQYLALAAGIVVEPFLHEFMETHGFDLTWSRVGAQLAFGLVMGLIVFPGVYKNAFDPTRPIFVQLCAIFASGIGWQSLFQAATSA